MKLSSRAVAAVAVIATLLAVGPAYAQKGGGKNKQSSKRVDVWKLEATCVADKLGFSKDETVKLVDAYTKTRADLQKTVAEKMKAARVAKSEGASKNRSESMKQFRQDIAKTAATKLKSALSGLDKDKMAKAISILGTYRPDWDRMVMAIIDLKLGEKQNEAIAITTGYVANTATVTGKPADVKKTQLEQKAKLDEAMKKVLSDEQMAKWTKATSIHARHGNMAANKSKGDKGSAKKGKGGGGKSGKHRGSKQQ